MAGNFQIQLHNFQLLEKSKKTDVKVKVLRFSLTWKVEVPNPNPELEQPQVWGMLIEGCLAYVSRLDGTLTWHPPQTRSGAMYANIMSLTPDLYAAVHKQLNESKYYKELAWPGQEPKMVYVPFTSEDLNEA